MYTQPHIQLNQSQTSSRVLLPGNPGRVKEIACLLEKPVGLASNREFVSFGGFYKCKRITVCSTGVGGPSTAIAVEELIALGARVLIRVVTCGGAWRPNVPLGSLVIPTACIRDEGTTKEYIDAEFPAVADFKVVSKLRESAKTNNVNYFIGINRSHDAYYGSQGSIVRWGKYLTDTRFQNVDTPILSSEMECAALFVIASLRNVTAGAVLAVNADPEPLRSRLEGKKQNVITENSTQKTKEVTKKAIRVALDAIVKL